MPPAISQVGNDRSLQEHPEMFDYKSDLINRYRVNDQENVVIIAGISIRLLECGNVEEFAQSLTNGSENIQIYSSYFSWGRASKNKHKSLQEKPQAIQSAHLDSSPEILN